MTPRIPEPELVVFDVNETLSDMAPIAERFADLGVGGHLADVWFASLLRDGFALTAAGAPQPFATVAEGLLRVVLARTSPIAGWRRRWRTSWTGSRLSEFIPTSQRESRHWRRQVTA